MSDWILLGGVMLFFAVVVALIFGIACLCTLFQDCRDHFKRKYLVETLKPFMLDPDFGAYQYPYLPPFPSEKVKRKLHKIYKNFSDRSMGPGIWAEVLRYLPFGLRHEIQFGHKYRSPLV